MNENIDSLHEEITHMLDKLKAKRNIRRQDLEAIIKKLSEYCGTAEISITSKSCVLEWELYDETSDDPFVPWTEGTLVISEHLSTLCVQDVLYPEQNTRNISLSDISDTWIDILVKNGVVTSLFEELKRTIEGLLNDDKTSIKVPRAISRPTVNLGSQINLNKYEHVMASWRKSQRLLSTDPESAVRQAVVLLETTCKHILDYSQVDYSGVKGGGALVKLVKLALSQLDIHQSSDPQFDIGRSIASLIGSLGAQRNSDSDAHGKGPNKPPVSQMEARLTVDIAGTLSTFLIETFEANTQQSV